MNKRIHFHTCFNDKDQKLEIYSHFCENFYRVAGYHSDGRLLFDGNRIEYYEVGNVVLRFTGKSIRFEKRPKVLPVDSNVATDAKSKRGRPVGWRKAKTHINALQLPEVPIHAPVKKISKPLANAEIDKRLTLILKTVGE